MRTLLIAALLVAVTVAARDPERPWWETSLASSTTAVAKAAAPASLDPVLGPGADLTWGIQPGGVFTMARVPQLPFPAGPGVSVLTVTGPAPLVLTGRTAYPVGGQVTAMLHFAKSGTAIFRVAQHPGAPDPKQPATPPPPWELTFTITAALENGTILAGVTEAGRALYDPAQLLPKSNWPELQRASSFVYEPRAYTRFLPGWPEDWRRLVEYDMASVPAVADKWLEVRIELGKDRARFWLDDHLVATKQDDALAPAGTMQLHLSPGLEFTGFAVQPLIETPGFEPLRLGGYANGKVFVHKNGMDPASLPPPGQVATVQGIPFVFAGERNGCDHLDISRSYLREANMDGYLPTYPYRYVGSTKRDPARIQLRVPNGQYDTLYLIAAAEDQADTVPVVTAMFFRPSAGFAENFVARVPLATAKTAPGDATPLPVRLANGKAVNLWLIKLALDPGRLSAFSDMDIVEIELAKGVELFRSYPDPISYGWHPAGLPSAVHVYAATLGGVPVGFTWEPDLFGHVWQAPAQPSYTAQLVNHVATAQAGKLTVVTKSFDGTETTRQERAVNLPAPPPNGKTPPLPVPVAIPLKLYGYHEVTATLELAGRTWTEKRSLVRLAPDTRSAKWTGKGPLFGYWSYGGGHHTPKNEHIVRLMTMAGARTSIGYPQNLPPDVQALVDQHWAATPAGAWEVQVQGWMAQEPLDAAKVAEYQKTTIEAFRKAREAIPAPRRPDHVYFFPEPHISGRMSAGCIPDYWGEAPFTPTPDEQRNLKLYFNCARIAAEAVRKEWPDLKILIPWGDPGFVWPLLRAGFPKNLIDGSGIDIPGFERIPERQLHEQSIHRLRFLKQEFAKAGLPAPQLQYCEGIFVPTEPGAVSWREQMDIYQRWALLSLAYGVKRFYSGWFAFDCGNYYGAEHYGGCGIQRRVPYCDPKPAYAAYATMTDRLNEAEFDGWLPTGSFSTYALRFRHETRGLVYALWTLRGKRPVTLELNQDGKVLVTDSMNNTKELASAAKQVTVLTDPSVVYVTFPVAAQAVGAVRVGTPDHGDAQPTPGAMMVADLGDGSWRFTNERDTLLETNHWAMMHYAGKFSATSADDSERGRVLVSKLEPQAQVHELMPWYNVLRPAKPVALKGAPARLGLWVRGASDWGRVIYLLRDAAGERWTSIGTKDQWNCDDAHSWSQFCFDGWRYLTFELPGHLGWDSFRLPGTTWWRAGDDGPVASRNVVDLPLALEAIVIEQRSHILYVNDVQPNASNQVAFGKLYVEYDQPAQATPEAVRISRLRMPLPPGMPALPNPVAEFARIGVGQPVRITQLTPPQHQYDGTRMHVQFETAAAAKTYYLWVGAYPDGRGAVNLTPNGLKPGDLVSGLRAGVKLYYWLTYVDQHNQPSKPSPVHAETTVDSFKEK